MRLTSSGSIPLPTSTSISIPDGTGAGATRQQQQLSTASAADQLLSSAAAVGNSYLVNLAHLGGGTNGKDDDENAMRLAEILGQTAR